MAPKKKEVVRVAKLDIIGGQAKPGPALASVGINMPEFTKAYNDATKDQIGKVIPVVIYAYKDKSFDFVLKTTPASILLKEAAGIQKGSANAKSTKVGKVTREQALEIAKYKLKDMNANDEEAALRMVVGSALQIGIEVEGVEPKCVSGKKGN
ncbi:MAG: 50S ribosomal protein L11 [Mycoplasma sp.]